MNPKKKKLIQDIKKIDGFIEMLDKMDEDFHPDNKDNGNNRSNTISAKWR